MKILQNLSGRMLTLPILALTVAGLSADTSAQYAERPHLVGSGEPAVDASGRSVKNKRVRAIHSEDNSLEGTTAYFYEKDPWLAYQLGRNLNYREFRRRDGVLNLKSVGALAGPMPDGVTAKITANNVTSCTFCHNQPQGTPGGGINFSKDSGFGRNSPHYFGGGLHEMIAQQIRDDIHNRVDSNDDGWISAKEASNYRGNLLIRPTPGAPPIDFGAPQLSEGTFGIPDLDEMIRVWYVDPLGRAVPQATRVDGVNTVGYTFELVAFGWGQAPGAGGSHGNLRGVNPTLRAFYWDPHNGHAGLQAYDPTTMDDPDKDGVSLPSLAGMPQFPMTHRPPDLGVFLHPLGFSTFDPDKDNMLNELSEGDLDLAEWFMLNAPAPAFAGRPSEFTAGQSAMAGLGCLECHVPDWTIKPADGTYAGDRRFFNLDVQWNQSAGRLEGEVEPLYTLVGDEYQRDFGSFFVKGFFSDMRQHEMGDGFKELGFDGNENTVWRTAPLWGVGSGFPWGHDGASLTLHDVIMRHGGDAQSSRDAYANAGASVQEDVITFLEKLVLYDYETLPTDLDGSGFIESNFIVAGKDTGPERFNAEWLFKVPLEIQGPVINAEGQTITSFAGVNIEDAYGELLEYRKDTDSDGWPDVWDTSPTHPGFKDGFN